NYQRQKGVGECRPEAAPFPGFRPVYPSNVLPGPRRFGGRDGAPVFVVPESVHIKEESVPPDIARLLFRRLRLSAAIDGFGPPSERNLLGLLRLLVLEEPRLPGRGLRPFLVYLQVLPVKFRVPLLKGVLDAYLKVLGHGP